MGCRWISSIGFVWGIFCSKAYSEIYVNIYTNNGQYVTRYAFDHVYYVQGLNGVGDADKFHIEGKNFNYDWAGNILGNTETVIRGTGMIVIEEKK